MEPTQHDSAPVRVNIQLPLPLDVAGTVMAAIGSRYPSTMIDTSHSDPGVMSLLVCETDRMREDLEEGPDQPVNPPALPVPASPVDAEALLSSIRDGAFGITPPEWVGRVAVGIAREVLDDHAAANYLEIAMRDQESLDEYKVIVCRPNRPSPHELRRLAEERALALEAALRAHGVDPVLV